METVLLMLVSFALFTGGCWYLARVVTSPANSTSQEYSRTAQRFARGYKVSAAATCLALWFWVLVSSFWSILSKPPL